MIDHISFAVNDFQKSLTFYDQTLSLLGYERLMTFNDEEHQVAGYGKNGKPAFWIGVKKQLSEKDKQEQIGQAAGLHVGFLAPDVESVHKWYDKCLDLGGKDNGAPGPRPEYHPGYYGGFIIDPDGWRIEACFQSYQGT
ncbi:MAG: VOC family protein [Proteobacteria bacterium]|nr:VOC family protein [Pseudomonadota bacterium]